MSKVPALIKPFVVDANVLYQVVEIVMLQFYKDKLHPVVYFSKNYCPAEKNYPEHEKKLLAIFKACQK